MEWNELEEGIYDLEDELTAFPDWDNLHRMADPNVFQWLNEAKSMFERFTN